MNTQEMAAKALVVIPEREILDSTPEAIAEMIDARLDVARETLKLLVEQRTGKKVP